jgi:3-phenylpropionate/trans-cinnamate dioxygenase ferredoxin reductase subunit
LHRQAGVDLRCSSSVTAFHGESRVREVELGTGERLDADLVIIGIGVLPNVEIAEAAGLECNNGIRVDACARTADPAIHAAGDCTNHRHPFVERFLRLESVHNAIEQSKSAADGLVGEERAFDEIPWFWSDQYDLKLQIAGVSIDFDRTVVRGEIGSGQFAIYYLRSGRPIAIDAVNWPREFMQGKSLLAARVTVPVEVLADPDADLSAYWESS